MLKPYTEYGLHQTVCYTSVLCNVLYQDEGAAGYQQLSESKQPTL